MLPGRMPTKFRWKHIWKKGIGPWPLKPTDNVRRYCRRNSAWNLSRKPNRFIAKSPASSRLLLIIKDTSPSRHPSGFVENGILGSTGISRFSSCYKAQFYPTNPMLHSRRYSLGRHHFYVLIMIIRITRYAQATAIY